MLIAHQRTRERSVGEEEGSEGGGAAVQIDVAIENVIRSLGRVEGVENGDR